MLDYDLWNPIQKAIDGKREDILHRMSCGKHNDISEYKRDVGILFGLKFVEDTKHDIYNPKRSEDD